VHRIARQILLGLAAAHRAGVLHRDLKSDNIMVTGYPLEPRVAITDFGLSRALDGRSRALGTLGHERVGSVAYMAPEQLLGQELGPESDVFGFGVVLFEMLCGALPFQVEGADSAELVSGRLRQRAPTPSALRPGVPGQLDALVLSCLNPAPGSRHRRAIDVLAMLDRVNDAGAFRPPPFSALRAHLRGASPRVS
jgi:serine/threonine-protein kinase